MTGLQASEVFLFYMYVPTKNNVGLPSDLPRYSRISSNVISLASPVEWRATVWTLGLFEAIAKVSKQRSHTILFVITLMFTQVSQLFHVNLSFSDYGKINGLAPPRWEWGRCFLFSRLGEFHRHHSA